MAALLLIVAPASSATTPSPTPSPSATQFTNSISGFLRGDDRAPIPGVTITATNGDFTGTTKSGANGAWTIGVPTQGTYEVKLDESTLPKGIKLAEGQENPRKVTFSQTSNLSVIFAFGKGIVVEEQNFGQNLLNRLVAGLSFGLLLALAAVGLSLIFGTTGLTNFAHGEMVTLGAVLVFAFNAMHLPFWLAIILAIVGGGLFGYVQDAGLWKPLRRRGTGLVPMMIVSIGLALAVRYIIQFYFGGATQQLPFAQSAEILIGPVSISPNNLFSLIVSAAVIAALGVVLLCGSATALAGPIGFVGLVVPHAVRFLTGPDYRWILPFSLVVAPMLLLAADIAGRVVLPPGEVPAGIMTALVGAPVFVWLIRRSKAAGL